MEIFRINNSIFNNYVTENNNDLYCYMIHFSLKFINFFFSCYYRLFWQITR